MDLLRAALDLGGWINGGGVPTTVHLLKEGWIRFQPSGSSLRLDLNLSEEGPILLWENHPDGLECRPSFRAALDFSAYVWALWFLGAGASPAEVAGCADEILRDLEDWVEADCPDREDWVTDDLWGYLEVRALMDRALGPKGLPAEFDRDPNPGGVDPAHAGDWVMTGGDR